MAIGNAVQRGQQVQIFDERARYLATIGGGTLHGFTSTTVSIRRGSLIYLYNERGHYIGSTSAR